MVCGSGQLVTLRVQYAAYGKPGVAQAGDAAHHVRVLQTVLMINARKSLYDTWAQRIGGKSGENGGTLQNSDDAVRYGENGLRHISARKWISAKTRVLVPSSLLYMRAHQALARRARRRPRSVV